MLTSCSRGCFCPQSAVSFKPGVCDKPETGSKWRENVLPARRPGKGKEGGGGGQGAKESIVRDRDRRTD